MATLTVGTNIPGILAAGASHGLSCFVNKTTPSDLSIHLFTNNHTPVDSDTVLSYTEPADASYAAISLTGSGWTVSGTPPVATYATQTFTFTTTTGLVYGVFYTRNSDGALIDAKLFPDGPYNIVRSGDTITFTPRFQ